MRKQIYKIVRKSTADDKISKLYDYFIMTTALLSVVPLMFKETNYILDMLDVITVYILFLDYIFRWMCFDYLSKDNRIFAFIKYPFTPFAIIDFVSILPSLGLLGKGYRILRMLRVFKLLHYSNTFTYISRVFEKERKTLSAVLVIAVAYIFVSALAMFSYEPDTFDNFFEALYWATTALTTVGYGDIFPVSDVGKFISMVSSLFGIAVIALPAGIVTGGFLEEMNTAKKEVEMEEANDE